MHARPAWIYAAQDISCILWIVSTDLFVNVLLMECSSWSWTVGYFMPVFRSDVDRVTKMSCHFIISSRNWLIRAGRVHFASKAVKWWVATISTLLNPISTFQAWQLEMLVWFQIRYWLIPSSSRMAMTASTLSHTAAWSRRWGETHRFRRVFPGSYSRLMRWLLSIRYQKYVIFSLSAPYTKVWPLQCMYRTDTASWHFRFLC